jgi:hypothetical protein
VQVSRPEVEGQFPKKMQTLTIIDADKDLRFKNHRTASPSRDFARRGSRDGVIWGVQTENLQLLYFTIVFFEKENDYIFSGLPFKFILDIKIAPDGAVWVSTEKGLYIYRE